MESLWFKIERTIVEVSTKNDFLDSSSVVSQWRGYEVYCMQKQFLQSSFAAKLVGKGFGTTLNVGNFSYLVTDESEIPTLHNGFYTCVLKLGILGVILYIGFFCSILRNIHSLPGTDMEKSLIRGLTVGYFINTALIHGTFAGGCSFVLFFVLGIVCARDRLIEVSKPTFYRIRSR